jgi:hypothetical protein
MSFSVKSGRYSSLLFISLHVLAGCRAEAPGTSSSEAGVASDVRIIESTEARWPEGKGWRVSEQPLVEIGAEQGDEAYALYRVTGARRLADGRIVVANMGTHQLLFFDASGQFLSSSGREGGGPGEFQALVGLWALNDGSLLAYDMRQRRVSVFQANGSFLRSYQPSLDASQFGFANPIGPFSDGSLLVMVGSAGGGKMREGPSRDPAFLIHLDDNGALVDTLAQIPGPEFYARSQTNQGGTTFIAVPIIFGRVPQLAQGTDDFYAGSSDAYEIEHYTVEGRHERTIRLDRPAVEVDSENVDAFKRAQLDRTPEAQRRVLEQRLADLPVAKTLPAHAQLVVDSENNLWVQDFPKVSDERTSWAVFEPEGAWLGTVDMAPGFSVYQIGPDFVLGRWNDEVGVEHVMLYELIKP